MRFTILRETAEPIRGFDLTPGCIWWPTDKPYLPILSPRDAFDVIPCGSILDLRREFDTLITAEAVLFHGGVIDERYYDFSAFLDHVKFDGKKIISARLVAATIVPKPFHIIGDDVNGPHRLPQS